MFVREVQLAQEGSLTHNLVNYIWNVGGTTDRQVETATAITTSYCYCYRNDHLCTDHNQDLQVIVHIHSPQSMQYLLFISQIFHPQDLTKRTFKEVQLKAKLRHTVTVVFLHLGDCLTSELFVLIFQNSQSVCADISEQSICSFLIGRVNRKNNHDEIVGVFVRVKVGFKNL
jgi:hypothetical protein